MDSTNSNTIKVTLRPHPIKAEILVKEVEKKTYREIFYDLNFPLSIEYALIYDGEKRVLPNQYDEIPNVPQIYIRLIPEGGVADAVGDAVEAVGDFFSDVGEAIVDGLNWITGKVVGFLDWVFGGNDNRPDQLTSPSIRGSSNPTLKGQRLPVLLGKHLVFPAHASSAYTVNVLYDDHKNLPDYPDRQRIRQLFCAGTKDMTIDQSTAKVGDTLVSNITQAQVNFFVVSIFVSFG